MKDTEYIAESIGSGLRAIANSVTPLSAMPCEDAAGIYVASLTEAVCGVTAGLMAIANAISELTEAVREAG